MHLFCILNMRGAATSQIEAERRRAAGYQEELRNAKEHHFLIVRTTSMCSIPSPPSRDPYLHDLLDTCASSHPSPVECEQYVAVPQPAVVARVIRLSRACCSKSK